jgi:6,7-dimethyl-8-ribityllumazine synthase
MMTSTLLVPAAALGGALLTALSYRHQRQFFAWTRKIRRKDEANTEYDKPTAWLADLYEAQCRLAQKPCRAEDFDGISQTGTMIKGITDHIEAIRPELTKVVEHVAKYVATALPEPGPAVRGVALPENRALLVKAMRQEAARDELAHAIFAAEQRIKDLRRG